MQTQEQSPALAVALWPENINRAVLSIGLVLIGTVVLAISAKIKVPFYPVPMTLQTFAVMALAAAYGSRLAVLTVLAYFLEGALGLPVFTNTPPAVAGPLYFLGTTGGFLIGFLPLALIVGWAADRGWDRSTPKLFAAMITADVVLFALGFAWLAWFAQLSPGLIEKLGLVAGAQGAGASFAWVNGVLPFVLGDLLKVALAALAVPAVWALVDRRA